MFTEQRQNAHVNSSTDAPATRSSLSQHYANPSVGNLRYSDGGAARREGSFPRAAIAAAAAVAAEMSPSCASRSRSCPQQQQQQQCLPAGSGYDRVLHRDPLGHAPTLASASARTGESAKSGNALLYDIQRTSELVMEYHRLKAQGGGKSEERQALRRRVRELKAEQEKQQQQQHRQKEPHAREKHLTTSLSPSSAPSHEVGLPREVRSPPPPLPSPPRIARAAHSSPRKAQFESPEEEGVRRLREDHNSNSTYGVPPRVAPASSCSLVPPQLTGTVAHDSTSYGTAAERARQTPLSAATVAVSARCPSAPVLHKRPSSSPCVTRAAAHQPLQAASKACPLHANSRRPLSSLSSLSSSVHMSQQPYEPQHATSMNGGPHLGKGSRMAPQTWERMASREVFPETAVASGHTRNDRSLRPGSWMPVPEQDPRYAVPSSSHLDVPLKGEVPKQHKDRLPYSNGGHYDDIYHPRRGSSHEHHHRYRDEEEEEKDGIDTAAGADVSAERRRRHQPLVQEQQQRRQLIPQGQLHYHYRQLENRRQEEEEEEEEEEGRVRAWRNEQARVLRSTCFAVILAESHVRGELQRRWERRLLKMLAEFREARVRIALSPRVIVERHAPTAAVAAAVGSKEDAALVGLREPECSNRQEPSQQRQKKDLSVSSLEALAEREVKKMEAMRQRLQEQQEEEEEKMVLKAAAAAAAAQEQKRREAERAAAAAVLRAQQEAQEREQNERERKEAEERQHRAREEEQEAAERKMRAAEAARALAEAEKEVQRRRAEAEAIATAEAEREKELARLQRLREEQQKQQHREERRVVVEQEAQARSLEEKHEAEQRDMRQLREVAQRKAVEVAARDRERKRRKAEEEEKAVAAAAAARQQALMQKLKDIDEMQQRLWHTQQDERELTEEEEEQERSSLRWQQQEDESAFMVAAALAKKKKEELQRQLLEAVEWVSDDVVRSVICDAAAQLVTERQEQQQQRQQYEQEQKKRQAAAEAEAEAVRLREQERQRREQEEAEAAAVAAAAETTRRALHAALIKVVESEAEARETLVNAEASDLVELDSAAAANVTLIAEREAAVAAAKREREEEQQARLEKEKAEASKILLPSDVKEKTDEQPVVKSGTPREIPPENAFFLTPVLHLSEHILDDLIKESAADHMRREKERAKVVAQITAEAAKVKAAYERQLALTEYEEHDTRTEIECAERTARAQVEGAARVEAEEAQEWVTAALKLHELQDQERERQEEERKVRERATAAEEAARQQESLEREAAAYQLQQQQQRVNDIFDASEGIMDTFVKAAAVAAIRCEAEEKEEATRKKEEEQRQQQEEAQGVEQMKRAVIQSLEEQARRVLTMEADCAEAGLAIMEDEACAYEELTERAASSAATAASAHKEEEEVEKEESRGLASKSVVECIPLPLVFKACDTMLERMITEAAAVATKGDDNVERDTAATAAELADVERRREVAAMEKSASSIDSSHRGSTDSSNGGEATMSLHLTSGDSSAAEAVIIGSATTADAAGIGASSMSWPPSAINADPVIQACNDIFQGLLCDAVVAAADPRLPSPGTAATDAATAATSSSSSTSPSPSPPPALMTLEELQPPCEKAPVCLSPKRTLASAMEAAAGTIDDEIRTDDDEDEEGDAEGASVGEADIPFEIDDVVKDNNVDTAAAAVAAVSGLHDEEQQQQDQREDALPQSDQATPTVAKGRQDRGGGGLHLESLADLLSALPKVEDTVPSDTANAGAEDASDGSMLAGPGSPSLRRMASQMPGSGSSGVLVSPPPPPTGAELLASCEPVLLEELSETLLNVFCTHAARVALQRMPDPHMPVCAAPSRLTQTPLQKCYSKGKYITDAQAAAISTEYVMGGEAAGEVLRVPGVDGDVTAVTYTHMKHVLHLGLTRALQRANSKAAAAFDAIGDEGEVKEGDGKIGGGAPVNNRTTASKSPLNIKEEADVASLLPLPADWAIAVECVSERVSSDFIAFATKLLLETRERRAMYCDDFSTAAAIEREALASVDVRALLATRLAPGDIRYLLLYYTDLARKGIVTSGLGVGGSGGGGGGGAAGSPPLSSGAHGGDASFTQPLLHENLFTRPVAGSVPGAPLFADMLSSSPVSPPGQTESGSFASSSFSSGGAGGAAATTIAGKTMFSGGNTPRAALSVDVQRSGLTQRVLEHTLENITQDLVSDTSNWLAELLAMASRKQAALATVPAAAEAK